MYQLDENILQHHGVLGQKWGVRRYQNKDGSRKKSLKRYEKSEKVRRSSKEENELSNATIRQTYILAGSTIVSSILRKYGNRKVSSISASMIVLGGTVANAIITKYENRD